MPAHTKKFETSGVSPMIHLPSGVKASGVFSRWSCSACFNKGTRLTPAEM